MFTATERGRSAGEWVQFGIAVLLVAAMFYPTVWMVLSAFKTDREIFRTPFALPDTWRWENFAKAWEIGRLGTLYLNSLFVTAVAVTLVRRLRHGSGIRLLAAGIPRAARSSTG